MWNQSQLKGKHNVNKQNKNIHKKSNKTQNTCEWELVDFNTAVYLKLPI